MTPHTTTHTTSRYARNKGFVLIYTVLTLSIMLLIAGVFADTVIKEVTISRDEAESLKAFYAAETGLECVRYYQNTYQAFDPTTPQQTHQCNVGTFVAGGDPGNRNGVTSACVADTRSFRLSGFLNGSCADVQVTIIPRTIIVNGSPVTICDADVISRGRNHCGTGSAKPTERTRWERI